MNVKTKLFSAFLIIILLFVIFFTINHFSKKQIYDNIKQLRAVSPEERNEAFNKLVKIGKPAVQPLLFALQYDSSYAKSSIASVLSSTFNNNVVEGFADFTKTESRDLKIGIIRVLRRIGDNRSVIPLINTIKNEDEQVKEEAFYALLRFDNLPVKLLIELSNNQDSDVRKYAALLLGFTKSPEAVEPLIKLLGDANIHDEVYKAAIIGLGKLGSIAFDGLVKTLDNKRASVNYGALCSLGRSGDPRAVEILLKPEKNKKLVKKVLNDPDYDLSYSFIKGPDVVEPLMGFIDSKDKEVRIRAIKCLGWIYDCRGRKKTLELLDDPDEDIVIAAVGNIRNYFFYNCYGSMEQKLYKYGYWQYENISFDVDSSKYNPKLITSLLKLFRSENRELRKEACSSLPEFLKRFAGKETEPGLSEKNRKLYRLMKTPLVFENRTYKSYEILLLQMLEDKDPNMRGNCALVLGEIGNKESVPALLRLFKDNDSEVRCKAAIALSFSKNPKVLQAMVNLLEDKSEKVVTSALDSLYSKDLKTVNNIYPLLKVMDSSNRLNKFRALEVLGKTGSRKAVKKILSQLYRMENGCREQAVEALGNLGDEDAVPALEDMIHFGESKAIIALGKIGGEKAIKVLINQFKNYNVDDFYLLNAFQTIGKTAKPYLLKALKNKNEKIRNGAREVLKHI